MADWHPPKTWKPGSLELTAAVFNYEIRDLLLYLYDNLGGTPYSIEAWIPAAADLVNFWADTGGTNTVSMYRKDSNGFVYLRGTIEGGTSNSVAFTLPSGYRPSTQIRYAAVGENITPAQIRILANGDVMPAAGGIWGTGDQITLDGVFHVD